MANARRFVKSNEDQIKLSLGEIIGDLDLGGLTIVAIVKKNSNAPWQSFYTPHDTDDDWINTFQLNDSSQMELSAIETGTVGGPTLNSSEGWCLIAVSKTSGNTTPRFHKYVQGTDTWTHENGSGTMGNGFAPNDFGPGGHIQIGSWMEDDFLDADLQIVGVFNSVLSDGDIEDLVDSAQAFVDKSPVGLWYFNQDDVSDPVTDLTGNGADQIDRSGTSIVAGPEWFGGLGGGNAHH